MIVINPKSTFVDEGDWMIVIIDIVYCCYYCSWWLLVLLCKSTKSMRMIALRINVVDEG